MELRTNGSNASPCVGCRHGYHQDSLRGHWLGHPRVGMYHPILLALKRVDRADECQIDGTAQSPQHQVQDAKARRSRHGKR